MKHVLSAAAFAVLALAGASANAGYAQLVPPTGASTGPAGQLMFKPAANQSWLQSTVRTNAALNVGGRTVQVPVAMRMAANAPAFMARAAFVHPALLAGALAAPFVIDWAQEHGFFLQDRQGLPKVWMKEMTGVQCDTTGNQMATNPNGWCQGAYGGSYTGTSTTSSSSDTQCRVQITCLHTYGSTVVHESFVPRVQTSQPPQPATPEAFESALSSPGGQAMPPEVPGELGVPVPVDAPIINPSPGLTPAPQPLVIPLGDPVPVPNTNPQQWQQPVARVVPSPTAADSWRVNVQEDQVVSNSPDPINDPDPTPDSPDPSKQDNTATDTPFGPVPQLYERKYPNGIKGVWDEKIAEIKTSSLFSVIPGLTPNLGDGGCPVWTMHADIGIVDFGTFDLSLPCSVWAFVRIVMIITALFLARRLIFGG